MPAKRKKVELTENVTFEQAKAAFDLYAETSALHERELNKMNERIEKIREMYSYEFEEYKEVLSKQHSILQSYAVNNRDVFGKKKSLEFNGGKIGFRTGTPSIKILKGFDSESVIKSLKKHLKAFVEVTYEPNKKKLIAARDKPEINKHFATCGISVVQKETFFVETKQLIEA